MTDQVVLDQTVPNKADLIVLALAADHSPYSQEYLSLRARQGKLRAIKRGRNWFTTLGWLDDYLEQAENAKKELGVTLATNIVAAPVIVAAEPVVEAVQPVVEATTEAFDFHPEAIRRPEDDARFTTADIELIAEPPVLSERPHFFWDDEPEPADLPLQHQELISHLQEKVDAALSEEGAAPIELDESDDLARVESDEVVDRPSFAELGLEPAALLEPSAGRPAPTSPPSSPAPHRLALVEIRPVLRPAVMAAVVFLLFSSAIIFNKPYRIDESIAVGAGVTLQTIGDRLIEMGVAQEQATLVRQDQQLDVIQASESQSDSSGGQVAGASVEQVQLSTHPLVRFFQTVEIGLATILE